MQLCVGLAYGSVRAWNEHKTRDGSRELSVAACVGIQKSYKRKIKQVNEGLHGKEMRWRLTWLGTKCRRFMFASTARVLSVAIHSQSMQICYCCVDDFPIMSTHTLRRHSYAMDANRYSYTCNAACHQCSKLRFKNPAL